MFKHRTFNLKCNTLVTVREWYRSRRPIRNKYYSPTVLANVNSNQS